MNFGQALKQLRARQGLTQEQVAHDLNISKQLVSHVETGRRRLHEEIARKSLSCYDDPIYAMNVMYEFSNGFTAPQLTGTSIEWHRLCIKEITVREMEKALAILNEVSLCKPPKEADWEERKRIASAVDELLDTEIAISNMKVILASEYSISLRKHMSRKIPDWKEKGWIRGQI
ncbi:helix-turn-helix domain-containing protein [Halobacillus shinanisalinarum]|uniref:Helix-turn-helix domain-containing protein n=1 Tax=Halobacillus shinanisalinarum TaxID=2932258 RepID=A0ABY4H0T1_9BACI|nr:helix-turn-helix transcriptional regulator [Halobacillus shinanisalinarum]UOQ94062.1 helix-turn-helix domain-containing protein [Halobacillus shinanisalinarum]